jgi:hypothetical protein
VKAFLITLSLVSSFASSFAFAQSVPWKITQPQWNENHEKSFGEFVARLGDAVEKRKCNRVDTCLKSEANPYFKSDAPGLTYYADCADLPYYLRAYFAWKNQLPFSVISKMQPNLLADGNPSDRDIRYSPKGNFIAERYDVLTKKSLFKTSVPNAISVLNNDIPGYTFSANYRITGNVDSKDLFTDFYPVKLNRQGIRPGTIIYDPNGHVALVYKVTDDGHIFYIDAHPDNSITMGLYTPKFVRSNPAQGAGFKRFRPLSLVDARQESNGLYVGGTIQATPNSQLKDYGTEQFFGTVPDPAGNWSKGKFTVKGNAVNYYDYVRMSLTLGEQHIDPLSDMAQIVDDICVSLQDRVAAVDGARTAGIDQKPHPIKLPYNIYGTDGEWENFSTPSRDARLKVSFMDLLDQTKRNLAAWKKHDPTIKYNGGNLAQDLYNVYAEKAKACQFSYTTSNGKSVLMNLEAGRQRLFAMSFDPYNCIERRWGARMPEELATCGDDNNKTAWYNQEQWLRNQWERRYDARMDYSLPELTGPLPGAGITTPPDIDIVTYLRSEM